MAAQRKRIMIFSPELQDRNDITDLVNDYFKRNFNGFNGILNTYSSLGEPYKDEQIGHWETGEILMIFDRRLIPRYQRVSLLPRETRRRYDILKISLQMSLKLCKEKEIPNIFYEGEKVKRKEGLFFSKIDTLKERIKGRLEQTI